MKKIWGYWYTALMAFILISGLTGILDNYSYQGGWGEAPTYVKIILPVVLVSMFGFFVLMLADFFSHRDVSNPILVGFSLLLFNWIAILIYFWFVVNRRNMSKKNLKERSSPTI